MNGKFLVTEATIPVVSNDSALPQFIAQPSPIYTSPYEKNFPVEGVVPFSHPNQFLIDHNKGRTDIKFQVVYDMADPRNEAITLPFVFSQVELGDKEKKNKDPAPLKSTFWLLFNEEGEPFELQYVQTIMFDFLASGDADNPLIRWPHMTCAVLKKEA